MKKYVISVGNFYDEVPKLFILDEDNEYDSLKKAILLYIESGTDPDHLERLQKEKEFQDSNDYPQTFEELKKKLHNQGAYFIEVNEIDISNDILGTKIDLLQLILKDKDFNMSSDWLIKIIFPDKEVSEIKDIIKCLDELQDMNKLYRSMSNFDKE